MEDALRPLKTGDIVQPGTKFYFKWTSEMCTNLQTWAMENGSEYPVLFTVDDENGNTLGSMDINIYTIARPVVTVVTLECTWGDRYEILSCADFLTQTWETPWIFPSLGERTSGVVTVFNCLEDYEDAEAVQDIVDHIFVDPLTLYNAESSGSGSEEFGSIIKNGIAYSLIYKNNVQYASIYLGGNRWWTYGTGSNNEIYKRRIMVGDNLNNTPIYHTFPKDYITSLAEQRAENSTNVFLEGTSTNAYMQDFYYDNNGSVAASYYDDNNNWQVTPFYAGQLNKPNNGTVATSPTIWGEGTTNTDFTVKTITDCPSYRHMYIQDSNIRPLEVGDYLDENTVLYAVVPDDFYQISSNLTEGESINNTFVKVESDFLYAGGDTVIGYDIGINDQGTYAYLGAPYYDIYCYQTGEYEDFWNTSTFSIEDLFDDGSNLFMEDCFVIEVDKNDPYYKYVLVDETTLGGRIEKIAEAIPNSEFTGESLTFSTPVTQQDLTSYDWIVEAKNGTQYKGRWENPESMGDTIVYYLSGTDYSITYGYINDNSCTIGSSFGSPTHTLYKIIPIE